MITGEIFSKQNFLTAFHSCRIANQRKWGVLCVCVRIGVCPHNVCNSHAALCIDMHLQQMQIEFDEHRSFIDTLQEQIGAYGRARGADATKRFNEQLGNKC
jgi:hypothetical protein